MLHQFLANSLSGDKIDFSTAVTRRQGANNRKGHLKEKAARGGNLSKVAVTTQSRNSVLDAAWLIVCVKSYSFINTG